MKHAVAIAALLAAAACTPAPPSYQAGSAPPGLVLDAHTYYTDGKATLRQPPRHPPRRIAAPEPVQPITRAAYRRAWAKKARRLAERKARFNEVQCSAQACPNNAVYQSLRIRRDQALRRAGQVVP